MRLSVWLGCCGLYLAALMAIAYAATSPPGGVSVPVVINPVDPGPRGGAAGAGGHLLGLSADEIAFFTAAIPRFSEIASVSGTVSGEAGRGLGPRFNLNSCAGCHAHPVVGGTSPSTNPQIAMATDAGATNIVPSFVTTSGPAREARFLSDGEMHPLFVITGRSDAPVGCTMAQPSLVPGNLAFRIPTPLFGLGLVEGVSDASLQAAQNISLNASLGVGSGHFNILDNGLIGRFGWKAQHRSVLEFSGEAYLAEMGVTSELFPIERQLDQPACEPNTLPEDNTVLAPGSSSGSAASDYSSDLLNFAGFIRLAAPPTPSCILGMTCSSGIQNGFAQFTAVGCAACHVQHQTTGQSAITGQSNLTFSPFSDFALHNMGAGLADHISQGSAIGEEFRTAPLWGVGKRLFFLHDGRTTDLLEAILLHSGSKSEANQVITNFRALSTAQQQDLIDFLRSL